MLCIVCTYTCRCCRWGLTGLTGPSNSLIPYSQQHHSLIKLLFTTIIIMRCPTYFCVILPSPDIFLTWTLRHIFLNGVRAVFGPTRHHIRLTVCLARLPLGCIYPLRLENGWVKTTSAGHHAMACVTLKRPIDVLGSPHLAEIQPLAKRKRCGPPIFATTPSPSRGIKRAKRRLDVDDAYSPNSGPASPAPSPFQRAISPTDPGKSRWESKAAVPAYWPR